MITRKEVNKLVRRLPKRLSRDNNRMQDVLHYQGKGKYVWLNMREHKTYENKMWFPLELSEVYEEDKKGDYKRKKLGYLDELFYEVINKSDVAKREKAFNKVESKVESVDKKMVNIRIQISENRSLIMKYWEKDENKLSKGNIVKELNRRLIEKGISFENKEIKIRDDIFELGVELSYITVGYWGEYLEVLKELDKYISIINKEERAREKKEEDELRGMFQERRRFRDNRPQSKMDSFKGRGRVGGNYRGVQSSYKGDSPLEKLNFYGEYIGSYEDSTVTITKKREDLYEVNQYDGELDIWLEFSSVDEINKQFNNILKR